VRAVIQLQYAKAPDGAAEKGAPHDH
jgi:hypothetical protein